MSRALDGTRPGSRPPDAGRPGNSHGETRMAMPRPVPVSLRHRVYARLIPRGRAEHLSRSRAEPGARVLRCHEWFGLAGLPRPEPCAPPAWAPGTLTPRDPDRLPVRRYEVFPGFVEARSSGVTGPATPRRIRSGQPASRGGGQGGEPPQPVIRVPEREAGTTLRSIRMTSSFDWARSFGRPQRGVALHECGVLTLRRGAFSGRTHDHPVSVANS